MCSVMLQGSTRKTSPVCSVRPDLGCLGREKVKQRKKRSPQLWDLLFDSPRQISFSPTEPKYAVP